MFLNVAKIQKLDAMNLGKINLSSVIYFWQNFLNQNYEIEKRGGDKEFLSKTILNKYE